MPAVVHTGPFTVSFKNEHTIHENEVRCLVLESDYNLSYNPDVTFIILNPKSSKLLIHFKEKLLL